MSENSENTVNMNEWEAWIGSCVLLDKNGNCAVKDGYKCSPSDMTCPFHKTAEQAEASEAEWKERMNSLSEEDQFFYAETYYKGKMPWKETEAETAPETESADCGE